MWSNNATDSLTFPAGATSGARITIDAKGIVIYGANNHPVFVASYNGSIPGNDTTNNPVVMGFSNVGQGPIYPTYPVSNMAFDLANGGSVTISAGENGAGSYYDFQITAQDVNGVPFTSMLKFDPFHGQIHMFESAIAGANSGYWFGAGIGGGYHHEEDQLPTTNVLGSTQNQLLKYSTANILNSDYGASAYTPATGVILIPTDGFWTIDAEVVSTGPLTNATRILLEIATGTVASTATTLKRVETDVFAGGAYGETVNLNKRFLSKGTSLLVRIGVISASPFTTLNTFGNVLTIHRDL